MADITKCSNEDCVLKKDCKRFTSIGGEVQSVMRFEPTKVGCNFFLKDKLVKKNVVGIR